MQLPQPQRLNRVRQTMRVIKLVAYERHCIAAAIAERAFKHRRGLGLYEYPPPGAFVDPRHVNLNYDDKPDWAGRLPPDLVASRGVKPKHDLRKIYRSLSPEELRHLHAENEEHGESKLGSK